MKKIKINKTLVCIGIMLLILSLVSCSNGRTEEPNGISDTQAPLIYAPEYGNCFVGDTVTLKDCKAYDDIDGELAVSVKAIGPSGEEITLHGNTFIAKAEGVYKIVYRASDKSGNTSEKECTFSAVEKAERSAPIITVGEGGRIAVAGEKYVLPKISAIDDIDGELAYKVELISGNDRIEIENEYLFNKLGKYTVEISAVNSAGLLAKESFEISVIDPVDSVEGIDGKLEEDFWNTDKVARLSIEKTDELDGVETLIYHDEKGIRIAFLGDVHDLTSRDVIMLYVSTSDPVHKIGSEILNDFYEVRGQYPDAGDFRFQINLMNAKIAEIKTGMYKDFANSVSTSAAKLSVNKNSKDHSYIAELYISYELLSADIEVTKENTLGFSVRLVGTNSRGSAEWNNLVYAGIYCDSESPASYVRVDKDGKVYAALDNSGDYRVDGVFDEDVYQGKKTEIKIGSSIAELYRSDKGIHVKYIFGKSDDEIDLVISTVDHKIGKPYVFDYRIRTIKNGEIYSSNGNSHDFYNESLYIPYSAPRAVIAKDGENTVVELFIPYDYLSRYNTSGNYTEKGYMQIDKNSNLRFAVECISGDKTVCEFTVGQTKYTDVSFYDPDTYIALKEE